MPNISLPSRYSLNRLPRIHKDSTLYIVKNPAESTITDEKQMKASARRPSDAKPHPRHVDPSCKQESSKSRDERTSVHTRANISEYGHASQSNLVKKPLILLASIFHNLLYFSSISPNRRRVVFALWVYTVFKRNI